MTFGQRLRELRNEKGLTQSQLAERVNLSKANISKYENGSVEPNLETLHLLAELFGVTTDVLLGKTDEITKKSIPGSEELEILKRKFIKYGIIKEDEDLTSEQLDDYLKKLSAIISAFKD